MPARPETLHRYVLHQRNYGAGEVSPEHTAEKGAAGWHIVRVPQDVRAGVVVPASRVQRFGKVTQTLLGETPPLNKDQQQQPNLSSLWITGLASGMASPSGATRGLTHVALAVSLLPHLLVP